MNIEQFPLTDHSVIKRLQAINTCQIDALKKINATSWTDKKWSTDIFPHIIDHIAHSAIEEFFDDIASAAQKDKSTILIINGMPISHHFPQPILDLYKNISETEVFNQICDNAFCKAKTALINSLSDSNHPLIEDLNFSLAQFANLSFTPDEAGCFMTEVATKIPGVNVRYTFLRYDLSPNNFGDVELVINPISPTNNDITKITSIPTTVFPSNLIRRSY